MLMLDWHRCYGEGWTGIIVPEAFAHPAKFSRALIRRIYEHMAARGWLTVGDTVVDPFGGVALGALEAMRRGLHWRGVELEQRFVDLGNANIAAWNATYGPHLPLWGTASLVQGDSRELASVIAAAGGCVSSPPYEGAVVKDRSSHLESARIESKGLSGAPFGMTRGELAFESYGSTPGNLGNLRAGDVEAVVSSPPFQDQNACNDPSYHVGRSGGGGPLYGDYGSTPGNVGNESGDTFWSAARTIVEQTHTVLAPGAHAAWVVKAFVRGGEIVDFPDQWRRLCEACGFTTVETVRAWLVEDRGAQYDLMGELHERQVQRKSFFRRLAEKNGSPAIDYEVVLFVEKP